MYYTPLYADRVFIRRHVEPAPCNPPLSRPLVSIAIRTHPIKPSAERVPALMNPTTIPSAPLIPNNELYERMLPHSARRAAPRQISTRWLRSITFDTIRAPGRILPTVCITDAEKRKHREASNDPRPRRLSTITSPEGIRIIPRLVMMFGKLTIGGYIT